MTNLVLPGACMGSYEEAAPGGVLQDDFTINTGDLAARVAQGTNGGWTWGHRGTVGDAYNTVDTDGLLCNVSGVNEDFFVDATGADHFVEVQLINNADLIGRSRGTLIRAAPSLSILLESRFNYQCRVYIVDGTTRITSGYITPAPTVAPNDLLRYAISGSVITMYVNDVSQGTHDISGDYASYPALQTNTQIGLYSENYTQGGSIARISTFRGGTGTGS